MANAFHWSQRHRDSHLGWVGLDLMLAILVPNDQPDAGGSVRRTDRTASTVQPWLVDDRVAHSITYPAGVGFSHMRRLICINAHYLGQAVYNAFQG
jgi:hypothetical protein